MTNTYTTTTVESKTADQEVEHVIGSIKALIAKGEKAAAKAEQFFIAAGQHLKTLKANHAGSWAEWELLLKERVKISTGRASELMQIADGRKTVDEVRAGKAESMKRVRSSPRGEDKPTPTAPATAQDDDDDARVEADRQQCVALYEKVKAAEQAAAAYRTQKAGHGWSVRLLQCQREVEKIGAEFANGTATLSDKGRDEVAHFARHLADAARALADRIKSSAVLAGLEPDAVERSAERRKTEAAEAEMTAGAVDDYPDLPATLDRRVPAGGAA
jgi:hypothetical protein